MKHIICWLSGHSFIVHLIDAHRFVLLGHLSTEAGCYSECGRCGRVMDDLSPEARQHFRGLGLTLKESTR
jgi:bacterioferritin-associated ferredoxin